MIVVRMSEHKIEQIHGEEVRLYQCGVQLYLSVFLQTIERRDLNNPRRVGGWASDLTDKGRKIISTEEEEYVTQCLNRPFAQYFKGL